MFNLPLPYATRILQLMNDITPPTPSAPQPEQPKDPSLTPQATPQSEPAAVVPAPSPEPAPAPNPAPAPTTPPAAAPAQPEQSSTLPLANPAAPQSSMPTAAEETSGSTLSSLAGSFFSGMSFLFSWIVFPLAAVLILHFFVFQAYHVVGTSMVPTLHQTDYLIISKVDYTKFLIQRDVFHKNKTYIPGRNQIIVFHYPKQPDLIFVKRVIGLPGEHVVIRNGQVTVYNKANPKGFDPNNGYEGRTQTTLGDIDEVVPSDSVFVLGDNRTPGGSFDSRDWGDLPSSYIIGNAVLRLLPLDQVKTF
jgi:signal peptidase I